jgi:aminomethyltransferase
MIDKGIPRHGYQVLDSAGKNIGQVTSGTISPVLGIGIGMGYVIKSLSTPGTEILIEVRGRGLKAQVTKVPFIQ